MQSSSSPSAPVPVKVDDVLTQSSPIEYSKHSEVNKPIQFNGVVDGIMPMGRSAMHVPLQKLTLPGNVSDETIVSDPKVNQIVDAKYLASTSGPSSPSSPMPAPSGEAPLISTPSGLSTNSYVPAWFTSDKNRLTTLTRNFLEGLERERMSKVDRAYLDRTCMEVSAADVSDMRRQAGLEA